jgi:glycosyltransferase involved in cell wall biosynthesis
VGSLVMPGENGFVVEPGDVEALAGAMIALCSKERRKQMGRRSLEIVEQLCDERSETAGYLNAIQRVALRM